MPLLDIFGFFRAESAKKKETLKNQFHLGAQHWMNFEF